MKYNCKIKKKIMSLTLNNYKIITLQYKYLYASILFFYIESIIYVNYKVFNVFEVRKEKLSKKI